MAAKFRKGDVLVVSAWDHNGNPGGNEGVRVMFVGMFLGRALRDHRRFLRLGTALYPERGGAVGIGRETFIIEKEVITIQNLGRVR